MKDYEEKNLSYRLLSLGATIGLFSGTLLFATALFSTIYNFLFTGKLQGSWLLLAVLPLWIFGACCFDYSEGDFGK